ncbi:hypothetical protein HMI54_006668 [Coelomomyces lativittatus]|nr:hypothetical protein HMI54_006668 [Coelomomyces lativittatus]
MHQLVLTAPSSKSMVSSHSFPCPYSSAYQNHPFIYSGRYIDEKNGFLYIYGYVSFLTANLPVVRLFPIQLMERKDWSSSLKKKRRKEKKEMKQEIEITDISASSQNYTGKSFFLKDLQRNYLSRLDLKKCKETKYNVKENSNTFSNYLNFRQKDISCSKLRKMIKG